MKIKSIASLLTVTVILCLSVVGCTKDLQKTTPLPGRGSSAIGDPNAAKPIGSGESLGNEGIGTVGLGPGSDLNGNVALPPGGGFPDWTEDRGSLANETVYFAFDKSNIRPEEVAKLERVAQMMKSLPGKALRVEGHCDERGTEEYNRALGERRALSAREYLVRLGLDPKWMETISFGEDKPADPGHNEAAWAKNRRAEFIVLSAPGTN
jgi:peptidoglycan-associated lipoprotein